MAADPSSADSSDVLHETLGRLAKKAGVKATILLDRASGAILKMEGQISSIHTSVGSRKAAAEGTGTADSGTGSGGFIDDALAKTSGPTSADGGSDVPADETKGARELAGLVWNYVKVSGDLVDAIDAEDELKLLRLRTKKQEFVIVPDPKYLLIVVHDTPPA